jgi:hypothetical protein
VDAPDHPRPCCAARIRKPISIPVSPTHTCVSMSIFVLLSGTAMLYPGAKSTGWKLNPLRLLGEPAKQGSAARRGVQPTANARIQGSGVNEEGPLRGLAGVWRGEAAGGFHE